MLKESFVKTIYGQKSVSHSFDHLQRVHKLGMKIARTENGVNYKILDAALWLHDIAREKEFEKGVCHAEEGSKMVVPILKKLKFNDKEIATVSNAIAVHRYSKGIMPKTKEAAILQDADRLDAIGAIAIARIFAHGGYNGRPIYNPDNTRAADRNTGIGHFYAKQLKLKPSTFHTKTARKIAKKRYDFIKSFLKQFHEEIK